MLYSSLTSSSVSICADAHSASLINIRHGNHTCNFAMRIIYVYGIGNKKQSGAGGQQCCKLALSLLFDIRSTLFRRSVTVYTLSEYLTHFSAQVMADARIVAIESDHFASIYRSFIDY